MRILAICGSLRADSSNRAILGAAAALARGQHAVEVWEGLGGLPHFNPDLDTAEPPASVSAFRAKVAAADAVLISSPEYAHGVPGSLKNGLDWLVGSGELVSKPVGLINPSPRSTHAQAALREILSVMSAIVVPGACVAIGLPGKTTIESAILADEAAAAALRTAVTALAGEVNRN